MPMSVRAAAPYAGKGQAVFASGRAGTQETAGWHGGGARYLLVMTDPEQPSPIVGADAEILTALFSPAGRDDPQAVLRTASVPGCRYAVVNAVLRDRRFVPPALPVRSPDLMFQTLMRWMLRVDEGRHRRLRARFGGLFTARRAEGFRVMVSNRANELADAIGDDASFDLVETFAEPLPFLVICDVMGVPDDQRDWLRRETDPSRWPAAVEEMLRTRRSGFWAALIGLAVVARRSGRSAGVRVATRRVHVIDYTTDDFTRESARYDVILDNVGNRPLSRLRRALAPAGILVLNGGGSPGHMAGPPGTMLRAAVVNGFVRQHLQFLPTREDRAELAAITALIEDGKLTPVLDRTYPMADTTGALRYVEGGHAHGKVILTVA